MGRYIGDEALDALAEAVRPCALASDRPFKFEAVGEQSSKSPWGSSGIDSGRQDPVVALQDTGCLVVSPVTATPSPSLLGSLTPAAPAMSPGLQWVLHSLGRKAGPVDGGE